MASSNAASLWIAHGTLFAALLLLRPASAVAPESDEALFGEAVTALEREAYDDAIDRFELLGDRGVMRANLSFNRALAYLGRGLGPRAEPGDLGQAVAGIEEARLLGDERPETAVLLEELRRQIARNSAQRGKAPVLVHPELGRALVGLLAENAWAVLAMVASVLTAIGLGFRLFGRELWRRVAGPVLLSVGSLILVLSLAATSAARSYRLNSQPAVLVHDKTPLLDERGLALTKSNQVEDNTVPEGSLLYVLERRGQLSRVQWGSASGWVRSPHIRVLQVGG
jgi:hypothetical protein